MRCQEGGGEEDDPPLVPRLGTRTGSTLLFSTTTRFCNMKQKRNYSFLTSRSIAKTSYTIRSSGVLLQTGRVFLMTFIVGVKSYMEVSNETSDNIRQVVSHTVECPSWYLVHINADDAFRQARIYAYHSRSRLIYSISHA